MTLRLGMPPSKRARKRATGYFDPSLHKALRVKAAETERSLSELVNAAIRQSLAEDAEDLAAFDDRAREPSLAFEDVLKDLKRCGKL
jgi:plasmid stability protein